MPPFMSMPHVLKVKALRLKRHRSLGKQLLLLTVPETVNKLNIMYLASSLLCPQRKLPAILPTYWNIPKKENNLKQQALLLT